MKEVKYVLVDTRGCIKTLRTERLALQYFSLEMELYNRSRGVERGHLFVPELTEEVLIESYYDFETGEWLE